MEYAITSLVVIAMSVVYIFAASRFIEWEYEQRAVAPSLALSKVSFWAILAGSYAAFILLLVLTTRFLPALPS